MIFSLSVELNELNQLNELNSINFCVCHMRHMASRSSKSRKERRSDCGGVYTTLIMFLDLRDIKVKHFINFCGYLLSQLLQR